jgi:hypothetical protein
VTAQRLRRNSATGTSSLSLAPCSSGHAPARSSAPTTSYADARPLTAPVIQRRNPSPHPARVRHKSQIGCAQLGPITCGGEK